MKRHKITKVDEGGIAEELGIEEGDFLLAINDKEIEDIFDYDFIVNDEYLEVLIEKANGEEWLLEVEKDYDEDLGMEFGESLMDEYRSCFNKCVFCFIDQNPPGMRETIYFKDDDTRLSFLQGNYVTLTNMKEKDIQRIIDYKLAPINISVHTTNPELRCQMLHNRFAGKVMDYIQMLYDADIPMNAQVVLCKGLNDGDELRRTIGDLLAYAPTIESLSVVPVGLSKYRDGLCQLESFTKEDAREVISIIEGFQQQAMEKFGEHFVHASDEWYITAGYDMPGEDRYDGYIQLENGVGMIRLLTTEVHEALDELEGDEEKEELSIATGKLAAVYLAGFLEEIKKKFPNRKVHLYPIRNDFFGEMITVAGLITGQDLIAQLKDKPLGDRLILPAVMFKSGEEIFLDDITKTQAEDALQIPINIVKSSGYDLVDAILDPEAAREQTAEHGAYELTMKDAGLTEDGEVIPDWDGEV